MFSGAYHRPMFGKLKSLFGGGDTSDAKPSGKIQLAMPLFTDATPIEPEAIVTAYDRLFATKGALRVIKTGDVPEFDLEGRCVMVVQIPAPVPHDEALHAVRSSWMWQKPDDVVRKHRAHAIVTAPSSNDPIRDATAVTRICAAMLSAGTGAALYWGNSHQVHTADVAIGFATDPKGSPVPLWVGITISGRSQSGPFSAATHGLEAIGHKEFEVIDTTMTIGNLRTTLLDLAMYVVERGPVLLDGQTFGPSATERWSVRHTRSKLVEGRAAIVLGIP